MPPKGQRSPIRIGMHELLRAGGADGVKESGLRGLRWLDGFASHKLAKAMQYLSGETGIIIERLGGDDKRTPPSAWRVAPTQTHSTQLRGAIRLKDDRAARPPGRRWTREELIAALSLYCRLPFGQLHASQPDISAMAAGMGRTPASVSMKLCNFASLDPELQARGIKGLDGASNLDEQVWDEFYGKWETLAEAVSEEQEGALMLQGASAVKGKKPRAMLTPPSVTEGRASVKVRRGQTFFRQAVLAAYDGKCCITRIAVPRLLRASHIVGWAADDGHRVNPCNGLALNTLHDAAFEGSGDGDERRPLMTLDEKCRVVLSKSLKGTMPGEVYEAWFERFEGKRIAEPEKFAPDAGCLERHRARFVG